MALDVLLETESVTVSARRLGLSQPAMSAQLAQLRAMFNDPLLTPSGRRLVSTSRAKSLKAPLRRVLGDLSALVRESAAFDPATAEVRFRLIGTDYVHAVAASPLLAACGRTAPGIRLAFMPFDPPAVWPALENEGADVAVVTGMDLPDAKSRVVFEEDFVVICRKGHPDGEFLRDLDRFCAADHLLVSPEGGGFVGAIDRSLTEMGRGRTVRASLPSFLLAPRVVAESDLVCVLPRRLASLDRDRINQYELPFPSPRFVLRLIWHPRRQADPAHLWFRTTIADLLRGI
ncbi:MAG: LysR family transcriptional regulator [Alphaproteobacteria bacterium]|nr:LysR family transcriptional regulator [Alphaproteobacteria bacterium]